MSEREPEDLLDRAASCDAFYSRAREYLRLRRNVTRRPPSHSGLIKKKIVLIPVKSSRGGIEKIIEINRARLITSSLFRLASRRKLQKFHASDVPRQLPPLRAVLPKNPPNYSTA
jgi:hypothetical protein